MQDEKSTCDGRACRPRALLRSEDGTPLEGSLRRAGDHRRGGLQHGSVRLPGSADGPLVRRPDRHHGPIPHRQLRVNREDVESARPQVAGFIVPAASHVTLWRAGRASARYLDVARHRRDPSEIERARSRATCARTAPGRGSCGDAGTPNLLRWWPSACLGARCSAGPRPAGDLRQAVAASTGRGAAERGPAPGPGAEGQRRGIVPARAGRFRVVATISG